MWTIIVAVSIVAVIVVLGWRAVSAPPSDPDPQSQPLEPGNSSPEFPEVGEDSTPRTSDGSPVPGSEEYRNRRGKK